MQIRLAACYIVKDEAEELERSIESLVQAVDELVIVETCPDEDVAKVADAYQAKRFSFVWENHFARARNFALSQVDSPWVIFPDADEYFRYPGEVREAVMEQIHSHGDIDAMMVTLYNIDMAQQGKSIGSCIVPRILRNATDIRYHGRIHETLQNSGRPLKVAYTDERLSMNHTGYSAERVKAKKNRNLELLLADIEVSGKTPFHDYHLAQEYFVVGDYRKALLHALEALDSDMRVIGGHGQLYHIAIESMHQLGMPLEDRLALSRVAVREFPFLPEFYAEQAMVLGAMGRLDEAEAGFDKAMEIYDGGRANCREASYFSNHAAAITCKKLGELAYMKGDRSRAAAWLQRAAGLDGQDAGIRELCQAYQKILNN